MSNTAYSGCAGKKRFDTWTQADRNARGMLRHRAGNAAAYHCRYCSWFHVGNHGERLPDRRKRTAMAIEEALAGT